MGGIPDARCGTIAPSRLLSLHDEFLLFSILAPSRYPIEGACTCTSGELICKIRSECYTLFLLSPSYSMQFYFIALEAQQSDASLSSPVLVSCSQISAKLNVSPDSRLCHRGEEIPGWSSASACRHQACKNQGREHQQAENISTKGRWERPASNATGHCSNPCPLSSEQQQQARKQAF